MPEGLPLIFTWDNKGELGIRVLREEELPGHLKPEARKRVRP